MFAVAGAAPVDALTLVTKRFASVGVFFGDREATTGQFVRVNVANVGDPDQAPNPCAAQVRFFDDADAVVRQERFSVANGRTGSLDLTAVYVGNPDIRVQVRATVQVATAIGDPNALCRTTLEVVDVETRRTAGFYGDPELVPAPLAQ